VVAAAVTLWLSFALYVAAPVLELPLGVARTLAGLFLAELVALLAASYGCEFGDCTSVGTVATTAAYTDLPVLTGVVLTALLIGRVRAAFS